MGVRLNEYIPEKEQTLRVFNKLDIPIMAKSKNRRDWKKSLHNVADKVVATADAIDETMHEIQKGFDKTADVLDSTGMGFSSTNMNKVRKSRKKKKNYSEPDIEFHL